MTIDEKRKALDEHCRRYLTCDNCKLLENNRKYGLCYSEELPDEVVEENYNIVFGEEDKRMREIRHMISFDGVIDYLSKFEPNQKNKETHERVMNRLNYENEKSKGAVIKKIPKLNGRDYFVQCGNCGCESVKEAWYKYCPNCGYKVIR